MEESCPSTSKNEAESEIASEIEPEPISKAQKPINTSPGAVKLRGWLNKSLRITMSDGRVLIGLFLCTDRDANVILGSCSEYLPEESSLGDAEDPRMLGLVMVPGKHIVNISVDEHADDKCWHEENHPVSEVASAEEVK